MTRLPEQEYQPDHGIWSPAVPRRETRRDESPPGAQSATLLSEAATEREKDEDGGRVEFVKEKLGFATVLTDIGAVASPLAVLVFAFVVLKTDGRLKDDAYDSFHNAITVLATIFPILFAAIMGRLMYQIARWKLERGATIESLEQLMGSRTLGSTFVTQFNLGAYNLLGLGLLLTWAFSPLGGQAILRMLDVRSETVTEGSAVAFYDTDAQSGFRGWLDTEDSAGALGDRNLEVMAILDSMYNAALLSPDVVRNDSQDLWGNVKIPYLTSYGDDTNTDWQTVPSLPSFEYSALVGLPLSNISTGNTTLQIESSYIHLDCFNLSRFSLGQDAGLIAQLNASTLENIDRDPEPNGTYVGWPMSDSSSTDYVQATWVLGLDRFLDPRWENTSFLASHGIDLNGEKKVSPAIFQNEQGIEVFDANLYFETVFRNPGQNPEWITAQCGVTQRYVESRIRCSRNIGANTRQNCTVISQRPSQAVHAPEAISHLSFRTVFSRVSQRLPRATHQETMRTQSDASLGFIQNPSTSGFGMKQTDLNLQNLTHATFGDRLGMLINSYMLLSQALNAIPSGSTDPEALFTPNITQAVQVDNFVQVYHISWPWITVCIISCFALLAGGILSVVFIHLAEGPEVLGYVSTVVRDSRFVEMPPHAGRMNGIDLTAMMRHERVQYGLALPAGHEKPLLGVARQEDVKRIVP